MSLHLSGGLALMQAAAAAESNDGGKLGERGDGRNPVQLPPGAKVSLHDANYTAMRPGSEP